MIDNQAAALSMAQTHIMARMLLSNQIRWVLIAILIHHSKSNINILVALW
jgi:hypothetical protein